MCVHRAWPVTHVTAVEREILPDSTDEEWPLGADLRPALRPSHSGDLAFTASSKDLGPRSSPRASQTFTRTWPCPGHGRQPGQPWRRPCPTRAQASPSLVWVSLTSATPRDQQTLEAHVCSSPVAGLHDRSVTHSGLPLASVLTNNLLTEASRAQLAASHLQPK